MILEVALPQDPKTYWYAKVVAFAGVLLLLRWLGNDSAEFWCNGLSTNIHAFGFSAIDDKHLDPPTFIEDQVRDMTHERLNAEINGSDDSVPSSIIEMVCVKSMIVQCSSVGFVFEDYTFKLILNFILFCIPT